MSKTVREVLTEYDLAENGEDGLSDKALVEILDWDAKTVWRDPNLDDHRWFTVQGVVKQLGDYFISTVDIVLKSERMNWSDAGWDACTILDDAKVVERKERRVTEVYYE